LTIYQVALSCTRFIVECAGALIPGSGALRYTAGRGYLNVVRYLFERTGLIEDARLVGDRKESSKSALTEAALEGNVEVIKFLLESGADVEVRTAGAVRGFHGTAEEQAENKGYAKAAKVLREWRTKA
jgi:ankyrin repeat protein